MAQVNLKIVLALFLLLLVAVHQIMHAVIRRQQLRQRTVVVQCRNDVGNVLTHIGFDEPRRCLQFGRTVGQVRGNHAVNQTFVVALLVQLQTVGEQREGNGREDAVRAELLQAVCDLNHGFAGGLLEHTLSVVKFCDYMVGAYPILNKDLLFTAAICHDIGKTKELSSFPENDYTDEGQLLGHIMIGAEMVGERIRTIEGFPVRMANELKHCILAHHGELEYGSPKKPALAEALALSFADNVDAKMETIREIFTNVPENNVEWQGFNRLLDSNIRRSSLK